MPDEIDLAQDHIEREMEQRMLQLRREKPPHPTANCIHCDEPARPGSRFCSSECLDDHEAQLRHMQREGMA